MVIVADIHGWIERLEELLVQLSGAVDDVHVLGDIVGLGIDGPDRRCVDILRERGFQAVLGNHETHALTSQAVRANLGADNVRYLESLPTHYQKGFCFFAHDVPPESDLRVRGLEDAVYAFDYLSQFDGVTTCFLGHYHHPLCVWYDPKNETRGIESRESFEMAEDRIYLVNPGALGVGDEGHYILFDPDAHTIHRRSLS